MFSIPVFHFYLFVCACIYVCEQVYVHVCSQGYKGQKTTSVIFPQEFATCSFEPGPLTDLQLTKQPKLAVQKPQKSACPHLPKTGITSVHHHTHIFTWVWGIKLKSLYLQGKHIAN